MLAQEGTSARDRTCTYLLTPWLEVGLGSEADGNGRLAHHYAARFGNLEALRLLVPHFVAGTVVLFDDWLFHDGWDLGESRAWREVSAEAGVEFAYISWHMQRVLVQVTAVTAARQEL